MTIYINLKGIILSETSHMEKDKHSMISVICGVFREGKKKKKDQTWAYQRMGMGMEEGIQNVQSPMIVHARSVMSGSLQPHGLSPARLLCSCDPPGKNT